MLVFLYPCLPKPSTTLFTPKTTTPPAHSPTLHHMKFASTKNLTFPDFVYLVVTFMSATTHPIATSYHLELMKASLLGMKIHRRPTGYTFWRRGQLFSLFMFILTWTPTWVLDSRLRGRFNSSIIIFQEFTPEQSSSPDSVLPTTSSDDFNSDSVLEHIPNVPKQVPLAQEHIPAVPEHVPAPAPDPPACCPHLPRSPPPPCTPSSHTIKPTKWGDASHFQKAGPSNSLPFPRGTGTEPNVDPRGVPAEEEADEQELANVGLVSTYSESEVISHICVEGWIVLSVLAFCLLDNFFVGQLLQYNNNPIINTELNCGEWSNFAIQYQYKWMSVFQHSNGWCSSITCLLKNYHMIQLWVQEMEKEHPTIDMNSKKKNNQI